MFHLLSFLLCPFRANESDDIRTMRLKQFCQCRHMGSSISEDNWGTPFFQDFNNILDDKYVSIFILCQLFGDFCIREIATSNGSEWCKTRYQQTLESLAYHLSLCICAV